MVGARPLLTDYHLRHAFISQWPLALRAADSSYLSNDPYICEMQVLSVRTLPAYINAALASLIGFDGAILTQHLLALSAVAWAAWIVARRAFGASELAALFAVMLVLFARPGFFGNGLEASDSAVGLPREMAKAFSLLTLAFWLTRRWTPMAFAFLGAAVFQGAYAVGLGLVLCAAHFASVPARVSPLTRIALALAVIVVSLAAVALLERLVIGPADDLVRIIAEFRNPHHLLWSHMSAEQYLRIFLIAGAALFLLVTLGGSGNRALLVCAGVMALSFTVFMLVDPFATRLGMGLQGGRLLFILPFFAIAAGVTVFDRFLLGRYPDLYSRIQKAAQAAGSSLATKLVALVAVVGAAVILFAPFLSVSANRLAKQAGYAPRDLLGRNSGSRDKRAIARAMRALPADALVLAPPHFGPLRFIAERALYVDFQAWSFPAPRAWAARMEKAYGPLERPGGSNWQPRAIAAWANTPCPELLARAARLGATHVVVMKLGEGCPTPVMSRGRYSVLSTGQPGVEPCAPR